MGAGQTAPMHILLRGGSCLVQSANGAKRTNRSHKQVAVAEPLPTSEFRIKREMTSSGSKWYVVQVATGRERAMCELIGRVAPKGLVGECFTPRYQTQKKVKGEWQDVECLLLPGYVIVDTNEPERLMQTLRKIPDFTRLLGVGETFVPLEKRDMEWMSALTQKGRRCVPMSVGVMEGDRVVVTSGPLVGQEALIKSVNRHRSLAILELQICGRTVTTKVGLAIVGKSGSGDKH